MQDFLQLRNKCEPKTKDRTYIELAYRIDQLTNPDKWLSTHEWVYEPKYDGVRCVLISGCPTSRYGNTLNFPYLFNIVLPAEFKDLCLDGELFAGTPYQTVAVKRHRTELPDLSQFKYYVFDLVPPETVLPPHKTYEKKLSERRKLLEQAYKALITDYPKLKTVIKLTPQYKIQWHDEQPSKVAYDIAADFIKQGFEGIMLKRVDSYYVSKRTRDWIKVKEAVDIDAEIIGFIEGTGKYRNSLGALILKPLPDQPAKSEFRVGSGFTDAQRKFIWEHRDVLLGMVVTVVAQTTTETGKARMPIFKYFRIDKKKKGLTKEMIAQMCALGLIRPDDCALNI